MKKIILFVLIAGIFTPGAFTQSGQEFDTDWYSFELEAELGVIKFLNHTLQFGETGTEFNYVTQGGQEILFPFERYEAGIRLFDNHVIRFLYQPFVVPTHVTFREDVTIDGTTFNSGTAMNLTYDFSFWRASYTYDFFAEEHIELGVGLSLQLRNASIRFEAVNGSALTTGQNLGPVPALNITAAWQFDNGLYAGTDITGIFASSAFINGADFDFEGSLLDASLRGGLRINEFADAFVNFRFLGGSAVGNSEYDATYWSENQTSYTENYLATITVTLGAKFRP